MIPTMVLCAGLGSRLRPLTEHAAKPLVPVGDRAMLAHILERLDRAHVPRIVVNAHHRAEDMLRFASAARAGGIVVVNEAELLGTAGGVSNARDALGAGDVLLWNGDILADLDVRALVHAHALAATLVIEPRPRGEGNVGVDARGEIVRLRDETVRDGEVHGGAFVGVHVLGGPLREKLPARGCLVGDLYLPALREGARLGVFATRAPWRDIGSLAAYHEANMAWLRERGERVWCGAASSVSDASALVDTIVGERAEAAAGAELVRCVVWPGAVARGRIADAIVTQDAVVPVSACARA